MTASQATPSATGRRASGRRRRMLHIAGVLLVFACICLLSSWVFNFSRGEALEFVLPASGATEPQRLDVAKDNAVYLVTVAQDTDQMAWNTGWSAVAGELLDADKNVLCGFGGEFWRAQGYDEGHWTEYQNDYKMKLTIPERGTYYLGFETELSSPEITSPVHVRVAPKLGSALPFFLLGMVSLLACLVVWWVAKD